MNGNPVQTDRSIIGTSSGGAEIRTPLALYVHVPWCVRKCPYCDFNSHAAPAGGVPGEAYAKALLADLDHELTLRPAGSARPVSVFFGGGTPSLLEPHTVARLLDGFRERLPLGKDVEVTLEANPGTIERGRFAEYAAAGVNRVSLGVQTFDDALLARIGRIHSADDARAAAAELHAAGLSNFNIDLMYALPGQRPEQAVADIEEAAAQGPRHLSWYELTLEPGTAFFRRPPRLPAESVAAQIEARGRSRLSGAGFRRYEVSAWAHPGYRCRHNDNYWGFGDYIGIGPGAHGKRSAGRDVVRSERIRSPARWLRLAGTAEAVGLRPVAAADRPFEFMLGALRRPGGVDWRQFEERTGLGRDCVTHTVAAACADGLLEETAAGVRPTARGMRYLNELQGRFLAA